LCEKGEEHQLEISRQRFAGNEKVHFVASDDLLDTSAILKEASLVLGNDSGPLHLASALGTRVLGLFGPSSPELTAPRNAEGVFLYKKVECSPCDQSRCARPDNSCMNLISADEVFQTAVEQLTDEPVAAVVANA
jgi:ADP-heptose:LPS heptosyltransferase